jgi:uncharacterized protein YxeA
MEEKKYDYEERYEDYGDDDSRRDDVGKSIRGYRIVIVLLAVILAGISALYFNLNRQQQHDYELLKIDRDSIQSDLSSLINDYDSLRYQNDSIAANLEKANEMMEQLKRERRWNYAKIKEYEREVGTLRSVMRNYLRQIDSLNTLNQKLAAENVSYRKVISTEKLRADVAEERVGELQNKVRQGSVLRARDIVVVPLNAKEKLVSRVKNAKILRVDFTVSANELAQAGNRTIYVCIKSPEGYLLTTEQMPTFDYQGAKVGYSASREIDYQNEDVDVSVYFHGSGFVAGAYAVEVYMDGSLVGKGNVSLR